MEVKRSPSACFQYGGRYFPGQLCRTKNIMAVEETEEAEEIDDGGPEDFGLIEMEENIGTLFL